jgi:SET domain-containing protein
MITDVDVRRTPDKGLGVFALQSFRAGDFIFRRRHGPTLTAADVASLSAGDRAHVTRLDVDRFAAVLPPGAYLNHACDPSAIRRGVNVIAWRDIAPGDEITLDYRVNALDGAPWSCACGSASCDGRVGSFFDLPDDRQQAYLPYAAAFIRREYRRRRVHSTP